jgi:hypothetical protein
MTEARRAGWAILAVVGTTAFALRAADAMAGLLSSIPRGVHPCASLAEAEARTGLRLDPLRRALGGHEVASAGIRRTLDSAIAVAWRPATSDGLPVTFFQSATGDIPTLLRPPLPAFHEIEIPLGPGRNARLRAATMEDGSVWQDLEWPEGRGRMALRTQGRTVELLRLARRMVEGAP